jgi:hypothetical protein
MLRNGDKSMFEQMPDSVLIPTSYQPFARLERLSPILKRELGLSHFDMPEETLEMYNTYFARFAVLIHAASLTACCFTLWVQVRELSFGWLVLLLPNVLVSMGVDTFAALRTVSLWHTATTRESWDVLRLALRDDVEVLRTYEALSHLRSWRALQFDMTIRALPAGMLAIGSSMFVFIAITFGLITLAQQAREVLHVISLGLLAVRLAIVYISDPLWQFRANTMWSLYCAVTVRDTTTASILALAGSFGARLLHLTMLTVLIMLTYRILDGRSLFVTQGNTLTSVVWFLAVGLLIVPVSRHVYTFIHRCFEGLALAALRKGE